MRFLTLILLLAFLKCFPQSDAVFKVSKQAPAKADTTIAITSGTFYFPTNYAPPVQDSFVTVISSINTSQNELNEIMGIPPEQYIISCQLIYDSAGKAVKLQWSADDFSTREPMQRIIEAKPKGKFTFDNIYVMQGRKKRKLPDKVIEVK